MHYKVALFCILLFSSWKGVAQTDPLYAQYLNNPLLINPAYSGLNKQFNASVSYRKQWAGFDGNPTTANVNMHSSLYNNKMGVGLIVLNDKIGANTNTQVHATYAYRIQFNQQTLSFGLQAGFLNFRSDNSKLNIYDPSDPAFYQYSNVNKPSLGAGVILSSYRYFIGLSAPRMLKATTSSGGVRSDLYNQHYYLMASYIWYVNEYIRFKPSVLLKGVKGSKFSADVNAAFTFKEQFTAGAFTRNLNTYGLMTQIRINDRYRFGYVFELPTNKSVGTQFTTHELTFSVNMPVLSFHDKIWTNPY